MADDRFTFFRSYYDALRTMKPAERDQAMMALLGYIFDGIEPRDLKPAPSLFIAMAKPVISARRRGAPTGNRNNPNGRRGKQDEDENGTDSEPNVEPNKTNSETNSEPNTGTNSKDKNQFSKEHGTWNMEHEKMDQGTMDHEPVDHGSGIMDQEDGTWNMDTTLSPPPGAGTVPPYREIASLWNEILGPKLPKVATLSETRRTHIRSRLAEWGKTRETQLETARTIFERMAASDFLNGSGDKGWRADFDWITKSPNNWVRVLEGNYDNRERRFESKAEDTLRQNVATMAALDDYYSRMDDNGNVRQIENQ